MTLSFYWYPKCSTCKNAKKWLDQHGLEYKSIHIVEETPSKEELLNMINNSHFPAKKFFNTSGKAYRELDMKDKLKEASIELMAEYLASDGMLIKRPLITNGEKVTVGFKEDTFNNVWL